MAALSRGAPAQADESAQITVFEKSGCLLRQLRPALLRGRDDRGKIGADAANVRQLPRPLQRGRVCHEVVAIDRARMVVTVRDLENGREYAEATTNWCCPRRAPCGVPLPGIDGKTPPWAHGGGRAAHPRMDATHPGPATVVGGGFIGWKWRKPAERGAKVTIVEKMAA